MQFRGLIALATSFALSACASSMSLEPWPPFSQEIVFQRGSATVVSSGATTVHVGPAASILDSSSRMRFHVAIHNTTEATLDFSTANIRAVQADGSTPLQVISAEQLQAEIDDGIRSQKIAAALGMMGNALNAANAGYQSTYGTVSAYGPGGYTQGTYTATSYNAGAAVAAQAQANAMNQNLIQNVRNAEADAAQFMSTVLQRHTLAPGTWYGGIVEIVPPTDKKLGQDFQIVITAAGEEHQARFRYGPAAK